jgi:hypothetical protein
MFEGQKMPLSQTENLLKDILKQYQNSLSDKVYVEENDDHDPLMDVFGITPNLKRENRQYWGRELGMCWQRLVTEIFRANCPEEYSPALKIGADEPCDCVLGNDAIDTKYRIGSGDAGTLKKFKQNGKLLSDKGLKPILLIVREDSLPAALGACVAGGWNIIQGEVSFQYIFSKSGFDLLAVLKNLADSKEFYIKR